MWLVAGSVNRGGGRFAAGGEVGLFLFISRQRRLLCYPWNDAGSRTSWVLGWGRRTVGVHGVVVGTKQATEQTNG